ncbi:MAG: DUF4255 domain-containing protein [Planctomycetia bacterium]|nr:MAG: DUF4255 domain-containing protein [Planctomycetia bacterium]TVL96176.1 MAG: DUF4255 domain-containing protein [Candidatus Brocadia sp. BL1]HQU30998.1 DUF4255 domain-containing protein [Candidatus Brocadia sapporoensis]
MLSHALTVVMNELNAHLAESYGSNSPQVGLRNLAEGFSGTAGERDRLYLSVVNIKDEKTLKNLPNYIRNDATLRAVYENPPVFLNFLILMAATHTDYTNALLILSRVIRFFQSKNVFTQDNVSPGSITNSSPINLLDQLETFKLIFDLYSPTLEEVNHLWGTLGGKQYPFVLYTLRMLEMKFRAVQSESGLITEVVSSFHHRKTVAP